MTNCVLQILTMGLWYEVDNATQFAKKFGINNGREFNMRVWEAIEMLQGMDGNKEVTVTIGKPKKVPGDPGFPMQYPAYPAYPNTPLWQVFPPGTVTCRQAVSKHDPSVRVH